MSAVKASFMFFFYSYYLIYFFSIYYAYFFYFIINIRFHRWGPQFAEMGDLADNQDNFGGWIISIFLA